MSRDQQQQDPPEQPEQLPEEAEQGRGDGGEGHLDQEGQVDQDHLGRCQPPLISVAATLCFHHHCFLPAEQEITGGREKSDFQIMNHIFHSDRKSIEFCITDEKCQTHPAASPPTTEPKSQELKVIAMSMRK